MSEQIRIGTNIDAEDILSIYAPFCTPSAVTSFEIIPPTVDEMRQRISTALVKYPWLVYEKDHRVVGYASASQYNARAAYDWSVSVSVYLDANARGLGIGKKLYTALFDVLREQGLFNAYALITVPNPASIALHKTMGFVEVGLTPKVGFKNQAWQDVAILWLALQPHSDAPRSFTEFSELNHTTIMQNG